MIVNQPWSLLPAPETTRQDPHADPAFGRKQRQNGDFTAELLKLSLNTSVVQSLGDHPAAGAAPLESSLESSLLQMDQLSLAKGRGGGMPAPELLQSLTASDRQSGLPLESLPVGSPAALAALIQTVAQTVAQHQPSVSTSDQPGPSSLRRVISAYTPQYSSEGLRQKIDFSTHRQPEPPIMAGHPVSTGHVAAPQAVQGREVAREAEPAAPSQPGVLAARFESTSRPDAIGYDRRGGTCYGTYQLSSRMGGLENFLKFLDSEAPDWAERLRGAGPANTKGRGGSMPAEWKRIHREDPDTFAALQHDFAQKAYYDPAARLVKQRTGIDPEQASAAMREVIWSTAVQHGVHGAANVFQRALDTASAGNTSLRESDLIQAIYNERKSRFTGSSPAIQSAVQNRFDQEMQLALALLPDERDVLV